MSDQVITKTEDSNEEIKFLQEYLRMQTVHPDPDYGEAIEFLKKQASSLELPFKIYNPFDEKNPVLVITKEGIYPDERSILLNSHMDVVPVFEDSWTHPPFGAEIDSSGKIYARGAQDMKSIGMMYLAAMRSIKKEGIKLRRTIHIVFTPDEEKGGEKGMREFAKTEDFKNLKVGFALDEGMASPTKEIPVFYAERSVWRFCFKISGNSGHGSLLLDNTAGEKLQFILNKMMALRTNQVCRLRSNPCMTTGDVSTINLTRIDGGVQSNVIPSLLTACFDCRLALDVNHIEFENMLQRWIQEIGGGIEIEYEQKRPPVAPTKTDQCNPYWMALKCATDNLGLKLKEQIFPGGTDSRYIREQGIPAIGFSPLNNTCILLHANDEYITVDTFLKGIEIYKNIIINLADVKEDK